MDSPGKRETKGSWRRAGINGRQEIYIHTENSLCVGINEVQIMQEIVLEERLTCIYQTGLSKLWNNHGDVTKGAGNVWEAQWAWGPDPNWAQVLLWL